MVNIDGHVLEIAFQAMSETASGTEAFKRAQQRRVTGPKYGPYALGLGCPNHRDEVRPAKPDRHAGAIDRVEGERIPCARPSVVAAINVVSEHHEIAVACANTAAPLVVGFEAIKATIPDGPIG